MPVEIRELIIKTEISGQGHQLSAGLKDKHMERLKKQLIDECKKIVAAAVKRNNSKR